MKATKAQIISTGNDLMKRFDFNKVYALMTLTGWKWGSEVPTVGELESTAWSLLYRIAEATEEWPELDHSRTSTGGFQWNLYTWTSGRVVLELTFKFESLSYSVEGS